MASRIGERTTLAARVAALAFTALVALGATDLFVQAAGRTGIPWLEALRAALIAMATLWLGWGAAQSLIGLMPAWRTGWPCRRAGPARHDGGTGREDGLADGAEHGIEHGIEHGVEHGVEHGIEHGGADAATHRLGVSPTSPSPRHRVRVAALVPVCNEAPAEVFARVAAMDESVVAAGLADQVHFVILSDTRAPAAAAAERHWFARLIAERGDQGRLWYRRRADGQGRKAGNVGDFIHRSGGAYDYALVLDADSLMEGATVAEMVRRMDACPELGLLQSLPRVIGARSVFGRAMQFAAALYSPVFARGTARLQGRTGPFWGHNALIRLPAFASSCGLPRLSGKPPFGGRVLSHDYVEAAMLARAGWAVRLDVDLDGSYEEGPDNLVAFARRDRRWCQGNLQHARLLLAHGLPRWCRFVFLQGIFAYLCSLIWAGFLITSVTAAATASAPEYFPQPGGLFPVFPHDRTAHIVGLALGVIGLLVLPKLLIVLRSIVTGEARSFGGARRLIRSAAAELALSSLTAPILLMYQLRAVVQVLAGRDGGWPSSQRGEGRLSLAEAWQACGWIGIAGGLFLLMLWGFTPSLLAWTLPVCLPMALAPVIVWYTSQPAAARLFGVPLETAAAPVIQASLRWQRRWAANGADPAEREHDAGTVASSRNARARA